MAHLARRFRQVIPILIVGLVWEVAGRIADSFLFPPISQIIVTYPQLIRSGELQAAFLVSMRAFLLGMALSVVVGIGMGLMMGRYDTVNDVVLPYVNALYSLPRAALTPVILIWFGVGFIGRVFLIFLGGSPPIILNTAAGVRNVDESLIEVGRSFQASESQMFREIILPGSLPFIAAGIRIGFDAPLSERSLLSSSSRSPDWAG